MKIYLAGKIGKNDWRTRIVDGIDGAWQPDTDEEWNSWPALRRAIFLQHDYIGPYFVGNAHGGFHGPETHGAGVNAKTTDYPSGYADNTALRYAVQGLCRRTVAECDILFAWIDRPDCYGALVEIGWAHALGRNISIAFSDEGLRRDMWFVSECAFWGGEFVGIPPEQALCTALVNENALPIREERVPNPTGYVYLITSGPHYKIGFAEVVDRRVTQIGVQMPYKTQLVHSIPTNNMRAAEKLLHTVYAEHRMNGEWFTLSPQQVARIKRIPGLFVR